MTNDTIQPQSPMSAVLEVFPGAQRALFRRLSQLLFLQHQAGSGSVCGRVDGDFGVLWSITNMRFKGFLFLLLVCATQSLTAGGPISFSPQLPPEWIVRSDQKLPPQKKITGHMVALANTNQTVSVVVSLTRLPKAEFEKGFEQCARNHFAGVIAGASPSGKGKIQDQRFELKNHDGKQIAEASCRISLPDQEIVFRGQCWFSEKRLIGWDAFAKGALPLDEMLKPVTESIKVAD